MRVYTSGDNPKITRKELRYATKYMSGLLMSKQLCKNLFVRVHSTEKLTQDGEECKACVGTIGKALPRRRFKLYLNTDCGKREQLLALAHEIAHIRQFTAGELTAEILEAADPADYYFSAWERDSNGYEKALYYSYQEHLRENGIEF